MTQDEDVHIIGVKETDPRYGVPDFAEEKQRALTAGPDGGPVSDRAEEILEILEITEILEILEFLAKNLAITRFSIYIPTTLKV